MPLRYAQTDDTLTARSQFMRAGWFGMVFVAFIGGFLGFAAYSIIIAGLDGDGAGVTHHLIGFLLVAVFFGWLPVFILGRQTVRLSRDVLERRFTVFGVTLIRRAVPAGRIRQITSAYKGDSESGAVRLVVQTADGTVAWGVHAEDDEVAELAQRLNHFRKGLPQKAP